EVVSRDRDEPAVDRADARNRAVGRKEPVAETRIHVIGEQAVLDPGTGIDEQVEPLTHRQLAERVLTFDELLAAHLERAGLARGQIADERSPIVARIGHRATALSKGARASPRTRRHPRPRPRSARSRSTCPGDTRAPRRRPSQARDRTT